MWARNWRSTTTRGGGSRSPARRERRAAQGLGQLCPEQGGGHHGGCQRLQALASLAVRFAGEPAAGGGRVPHDLHVHAPRSTCYGAPSAAVDNAGARGSSDPPAPAC